jgi:prepilin-type N-terminal cleavage/methylation domain-containing protein
MRIDKWRSSGFTLIELLVVMAIITILASMLLPSLGRAKEQARMVQCLSNLRQVGIGIRLYMDDHNSKFPPRKVYEPITGAAKDTLETIGGFDALPEWKDYPTAKIRPLYDYLRPSEVYRCPVDKGQKKSGPSGKLMKPSKWKNIGCSYTYNAGSLHYLRGGGFRQTPADQAYGLAERNEDWVPSPERYILAHEPPAALYHCIPGPYYWGQWHFCYGPSDIDDPQSARQQFISPILFVDGHTAQCNFSKSLSIDPYYPYEPTKDWIWYKPADDSPIKRK